MPAGSHTESVYCPQGGWGMQCEGDAVVVQWRCKGEGGRGRWSVEVVGRQAGGPKRCKRAAAEASAHLQLVPGHPPALLACCPACTRGMGRREGELGQGGAGGWGAAGQRASRRAERWGRTHRCCLEAVPQPQVHARGLGGCWWRRPSMSGAAVRADRSGQHPNHHTDTRRRRAGSLALVRVEPAALPYPQAHPPQAWERVGAWKIGGTCTSTPGSSSTSRHTLTHTPAPSRVACARTRRVGSPPLPPGTPPTGLGESWGLEDWRNMHNHTWQQQHQQTHTHTHTRRAGSLALHAQHRAVLPYTRPHPPQAWVKAGVQTSSSWQHTSPPTTPHTPHTPSHHHGNETHCCDRHAGRLELWRHLCGVFTHQGTSTAGPNEAWA